MEIAFELQTHHLSATTQQQNKSENSVFIAGFVCDFMVNEFVLQVHCNLKSASLSKK